MALPEIPDTHALRYVLKGSCNRCGKCCEVEDDGLPCEHLSYDEEGLAVCAIYEDRWPRCHNFPAAPPIMIDECSYYFLDTWDEDKKEGMRTVGVKEV